MSNKKLALIILVMAFLAEYFHTLFTGVVHSYYFRNGITTPIYWDDMIYYFFHESFVFLLIIIIRVKAGTDRATKSILTGLIVWFFIEWIEIILQLLGISDARLFINDGSWLQFITCLTIAFLVYFGKRKLL